MSEIASEMIATPIQTPDRLIALAIESNADVEKLERLFDLQVRHEEGLAKKAYFAALSAFQANAPSIPKDKTVMNTDGKSERYKYASLDGIFKVLREPLSSNGLSWKFECSRVEDSLTVTCVLTHIQGHAESSTVIVPAVSGYGTNAAQDEGSLMSYGKRYSFTNLTGVMADEDNDAATTAPQNIDRLLKQSQVIREWFDSIVSIKHGLDENGDIDEAAEAYAELTKDELMALNIAPSKGGVFTTEERAAFKSNKEFQDKVHILRTDAGWYNQENNQV